MKNKPAKISQKGFIPIPLLVLFLIIGTGVVAVKVAEKAHVLGTSVLLAENGDGTGPAGGDGSGGSSGGGSPGDGGGGGNPQPQQQSAPQQQSQSQPQQPPQNSQNSGPSGSGSGGSGPNNPNPGTPQVDNRPLNQQNNANQQNPNPGTPQKDFRPLMNQQNTGPSGSGLGGPGSNNPNPGTPQDDSRRSLNSQNSGPAGSGRGGPGSNNPGEQQKFQQLQQQWQQEATKFGFQIQNPTNQNDNSGPGNQRNLSNGQLPPLNSFPSIQGNFNVQGGAGGGEQINLNDGTRVNLGSLRAIRPDGTQVEIDKDAREKIQAVIKLETGSEFSQTGNTFTVKRGEVSASTDLPVSFNVATKTFTVQTGNGEQEVNVLPDQAVAKIAESSANFNADSQGIKLIEFNNEPVFEIPGTSKQRFFGFIPIGIQQTSLVSAKDGNLLTTNQSTFSRIVDTFSF